MKNKQPVFRQSRALRLAGAWAVAASLFAGLASSALAVSNTIVISQLYGAGGNSGAVYNADYIELFNRSCSNVTLSGWSLQYASSAGSTWNNKINLPEITMPSGGYYLVQMAGGTNGVALPVSADVVNTAINMAGASGKIALVSSITQLPTGLANPTTDATVVDFVGFGAANASEGGTAAPLMSATAADARKSGGCTETDNNGADFQSITLSAASPSMHNSQSPVAPCPGPCPLTASGTASPSPVLLPGIVTLKVTVIPGKNPDSTGIAVKGDLSGLLGAGHENEVFNETGVNTFSLDASLTCSVTTGDKSVPFTVTDEQGGLVSSKIDFTVQAGSANIVGQPKPAVVCQGGTATFAVFATGSSLAYKWRDNSGYLSDGGDYSGATTATLKISNADSHIANGPFKVEVSSGCGAPVVSDAVPITVGGPATSTVVISQVYGGGGNSGSTLSHDFIELFNYGQTDVNVDGWSLQYASFNADPTNSTPTFGNPIRITYLSGFIPAGHYFLVQENPAGTSNLPTPDVNGSTQPQGPLFISGQGAKIALLNHSMPLSGECPNDPGLNPDACGLVDFLGWGVGTTCYEGSGPLGDTTSTTAAVRKSACTDTNDNAADFEIKTALPHNSASSTAPGFTTDGQPANQTACVGRKAVFTAVTDAVCATYQWQTLENGDWVSVTGGTGANTTSYITPNATAGDDGRQYRLQVSNPYGAPAASNPATLAVTSPPPTEAQKKVLISQIYGAGGLNAPTPAVYTHDFVELFNRGTEPVDLTGWSLQYASTQGSSWGTKVNLTGTINPGTYYVIQYAGGTRPGSDLPWTADVTSTADLASAAGKLALVASTTTLPGVTCANRCDVVDFVAYGSTASCFEGTGPAPYGDPAVDTSTGTRRISASVDTDNNQADFVVAAAKPRLIVADFNNDGLVNQADFDMFAPCATGSAIPLAAGCEDRDLDHDGDVDQYDFGALQRCLNGSNAPVKTCLIP